MSRVLVQFFFALVSVVSLRAADAAATTTAAAATTPPPAAPVADTVKTKEVTDLLERFVNWLHHFFPTIDDQLFHYIACGILLALAIVLRKIITNVIFHYLKKLAENTETTLDDKLFPALEGPVATMVMVLGIFAALTVLQLSEHVDKLISNGAIIAVLGVLLWGVIRAGGAILDHLEEIAHEKQMTVATFMPLIKKTLFVLALIIGIIIIADSLGAKVGALITSLGIGGLAFALAAQDTIANLFGSFVVVIDQPFKVGDVVKLAAGEGKVEDIGLRSTKVRTGARTLVVIPNKTVAAEAITNFSRMPQRRVDQVLGLTYDTTAEQMQAILEDIRALLKADIGVHPDTIIVHFANYGASSLDIQLVYFTADPDWGRHMAVRERINLKIMQAIAARGLSFAFPTQTVMLDGQVAKQLAARSHTPRA